MTFWGCQDTDAKFPYKEIDSVDGNDIVKVTTELCSLSEQFRHCWPVMIRTKETDCFSLGSSSSSESLPTETPITEKNYVIKEKSPFQYPALSLLVTHFGRQRSNNVFQENFLKLISFVLVAGEPM